MKILCYFHFHHALAHPPRMSRSSGSLGDAGVVLLLLLLLLLLLSDRAQLGQVCGCCCSMYGHRRRRCRDRDHDRDAALASDGCAPVLLRVER